MKSLFFKKSNVTESKVPMISVEYGKKDWVMSKGLAEVISNVFDTKTEYELYWKDGVAHMTDNGPGIPKKAFYMGSSSKGVDTDTIGMFGEGLKMAIVTAVRNNRAFSIQTVGYGVECESIENDGVVGIQFLFTDNSRESGTEIRVECTEEEWDEARRMFIVLRNDYKSIDKNIYLPGGFVMCNGVQIEIQDNLLFSYDIRDKKSLNRDRNSVAARALTKNLPKLLSGIKSEDAIITYVKGLFEGKIYDEYRIAIILSDRQKNAWVNAIKKEYGDKVVSASSDDMKNLRLAANGYTVIPCPTSDVRQLLTGIGLEKTVSVLKGLENSEAELKTNIVIEEEKEIEYPISIDYSPKWTYKEAGREIVANGFDAKGYKPLEVYWENQKMYVCDTGNGIDMANLAFGNSKSKANDEKIGMFGEGLKLAFLVMAREGREMIIETVGKNYYPLIQKSKKLPLDVLVLKYEENKRKKGTKISFNATEKEYNEIRDLFICFKDNLEMVSTPDMDVITNENNAIYIQGLSVKKINSFFAYNIKDKLAINSRDRNNVDDSILQKKICEFYRLTSDKKVIEKYLTCWKENPGFYEYTCNFEVYHMKSWNKVIGEVFKTACIASYNHKNNFIASLAGYEIISDVPANLKEILRRALPSADNIAFEYGDNGILFNDTITYPITCDYVSDWSVKKGLIEILSNALDTNTKVSIETDSTEIFIEDEGKGLSKKNLFMGSSESRDKATAIGMFGEGLKLACLAITRNGNPVIIETVGFTAKASIHHNKTFNEDMLVLNLTETNRKSGTKIICSPTKEQMKMVGYKNTKELIEGAKEQFIVYNDKMKKADKNANIYATPGKIYVNGVFVTTTDSTIFSYNIIGNKTLLLNRDRNSITFEEVTRRINDIFVTVKSEDIINEFLKSRKSNPIEAHHRYFGMKSDVKRIWLKAAKNIFKDCCIESGDPEIDHRAMYLKDCKVLNAMNTPSHILELLSLINFPTTRTVITKSDNKKIKNNTVDESELSESELKRWKFVQEYVSKMFGEEELDHIFISNSLNDDIQACDKARTTLGACVNSKDCYILRDLFTEDYSLQDLLGTVEHEFAHKISKSSDVTVDFEAMLTKRLGILGEMVFQS